MKVILAPNAGFCFGVRRAIDFVYDNLDNPVSLYTLGPIIHNPSVVSQLNEKGVRVAERIQDISSGRVVIRSHGVGQNIYDQIKKDGLEYIDATCPYVKRIHRIVEEYHENGYDIIIIGENDHPEVMGINGWCEGEAFVVYNKKDVYSLPAIKKACIVAQTTIQRSKWDELIDLLSHKIHDMEIFNTICYATTQRQQEAESIAKTVDVMFVIGGKNSSNTKKLYNICQSYCNNTFAIETAADINFNVIGPQDIIGITAGASTPDWIIEEVMEKMNALDDKNNGSQVPEEKEEVLENQDEKDLEVADEGLEEKRAPETMDGVAEDEGTEAPESADEEVDEEEDTSPEDVTAGDLTTMEDFEETMVSLRTGQVVTGTVLSVSDTEIIINIGYKSDGILPLNQIIMEEEQSLSEIFSPGDELDVEVLKVNDGEGNVMLSQKSVKKRQMWEAIEEGFESEKEFEGTGVEAVKGGVIAKINGLRAFVPASHLSTRYVEDLNVFVGEPLRLKIIELERGRGRIVASQKVILESEEQEKREKLWDSIEEGQKITGVVKRLTNFGAFVDIGGVDGLIHISDLSWGHIDNPRDVISEEEEVEVLILSIDRDRERISLGYKQTLPHPWDNVEEKYPADAIVTGKVVRITSFGAFVELEPGVDGLVHISQVANRRIDKVEDELGIGEEVEVKVLDSNSSDRRISLSIRELLPDDQDRKPKQNKSKGKKDKKQSKGKFEKEDMTVSLGEFFPEDFN